MILLHQHWLNSWKRTCSGLARPRKDYPHHIALVRPCHPAPAGPITTPLAVQAACDARDSLAKVVYARLFDWLVAAVNAAVDEAHNTHTNGGPAAAGARGKQAEHLSIGLLDIYGFESFEVRFSCCSIFLVIGFAWAKLDAIRTCVPLNCTLWRR